MSTMRRGTFCQEDDVKNMIQSQRELNFSFSSYRT
jgi:hypothetical protein